MGAATISSSVRRSGGGPGCPVRSLRKAMIGPAAAQASAQSATGPSGACRHPPANRSGASCRVLLRPSASSNANSVGFRNRPNAGVSPWLLDLSNRASPEPTSSRPPLTSDCDSSRVLALASGGVAASAGARLAMLLTLADVRVPDHLQTHRLDLGRCCCRVISVAPRGAVSRSLSTGSDRPDPETRVIAIAQKHETASPRPADTRQFRNHEAPALSRGLIDLAPASAKERFRQSAGRGCPTSAGLLLRSKPAARYGQFEAAEASAPGRLREHGSRTRSAQRRMEAGVWRAGGRANERRSAA
jgi:hypothetical protein